MTREEALDFFANEIQCMDNDKALGICSDFGVNTMAGNYLQACEWAVKALQELPIARKEAKRWKRKWVMDRKTNEQTNRE